MDLVYQLDLGLLILSDDLAQPLWVMLLCGVGQSQLKLLLLFMKGTGTHKALAYLLIRLFLHILLRLRLDFFLLGLDRFRGLLLLGLEGFADGILSHEGSHLTAEVGLAGVETGIHDLYAALGRKRCYHVELEEVGDVAAFGLLYGLDEDLRLQKLPREVRVLEHASTE